MTPNRAPDLEITINPRYFKYEPYQRLSEKAQLERWAMKLLADAGFRLSPMGTHVVAPFTREKLVDGRITYRQWLTVTAPPPKPRTACVRIMPDALDRMEVDPAIRPDNRYHPELEGPMRKAGFRFAADSSLIGNIEAFYDPDGAYYIVQEFPR